ncbi:MAG: restriction endonuclease subunit S, partial [Pseudomonadales bacterium]|nr:restriction endonuclease subunit S [Pseudomonadales bacterium]
MEQVLYSLPDGWEWQTFNDVCTNITDGAHASPKTVDEGFPYVTVRDVNHKGQIDLINCKRISENDFLSLKKGNCLPPVDSVLLSKDGTVGKVAHVTNDYDEFVVLSSLAIIAPDKTSLSPEYLKYFLLSPEFQDHAIGSKTGAAIKRIVLRTI